MYLGLRAQIITGYFSAVSYNYIQNVAIITCYTHYCSVVIFSMKYSNLIELRATLPGPVVEMVGVDK